MGGLMRSPHSFSDPICHRGADNQVNNSSQKKQQPAAKELLYRVVKKSKWRDKQ
jgi:hypothetical protein